VISITGCGGSAPPVSVAVTAAAKTVDGTDSTTLSATVTNDQNSAGVTWTVSGGGTLSNTTTTGATYTAPTATNSAINATVTATSVADNTKSASATISVPAAPAITTTALTANVGVLFSSTLSATGGISPYKWSVTKGSLPTSWSLSSAGVVSGPAPVAGEAGTTDVTIEVTDSGTATALTATQQLAITINPAPAITFATPMLPAAVFNTQYTGGVSAAGGAGALTYSLNTGALPNNLSLNPGTGAITGTATKAGAFSFTIKAADAFGDSAISPPYGITVSYSPVNIVPSGGSLPVAYAGSAYSATLTASGGSGTGYAWTATGLPSWLSISPTTGALTGKPTTAASAVSFTVKVTDSASNIGSGTYSVTVDPGVSIAPSGGSLPTAYAGSAYSTTLTASGGSGTGYTWTATGLPAWLSISPTTGALTGKPTATASAVSFTVTVVDSVGNTASGNYNVTVKAGISIAPPGGALPAAYANTLYSTTLTASGGSGTGYTWSATGLPSWLSISPTTGVLTGTPTTAPAANQFTVTVTDSAGNTDSGSYTLAVNVGVSIAPSGGSLPAAYVGATYSTKLTASGGSGTGYTWSATGLPSWLSISPTTGALTGKPTVAASAASFTVKVTDSALNTGSGSYSVTVDPGVSIAPSGGSLPAAYVGATYSTTLTASGGSGTGYTWSATGLPSWLSISPTTGALTGKPTAAASAVSFTVTVVDSAGNTASGSYSVAVNAGISITPPGGALPAAFSNALYSYTLTASGGSGTGYVWSAAGLPSWLKIAPSTGVLSGTPTATASAVSFTVTVTDSASNTASGSYSVTVNVGIGINPSGGALPTAYVGAAYSTTLTASGGSGTGYTWSATGLPSWLTIAPATGVLSGMPTAAASAVNFTVKVTDSASNTGSGSYSVTVNPVVSIAPSGGSLPTAYVGGAYSTTLTASGGSGTGYAWSATGLPSWLSIAPATGILSGTPTAPASAVSFTVKVTDSASNTASGSYNVTVSAGLTITTASPLPNGFAGTAYSTALTTSGGTGTGLTWTVTSGTSSLAAVGLSVSGAGVVSGPAPIAGSATFTVSVTDSASNTASKTFTVTIEGKLAITTTTLPTGVVSINYSQTLQATGGTGSYTWSVTAGATQLAAVGLTLNPSTGVLSGTTATLAAGTATFTVQVADTASHTATATLSVTINASLVITTTTLSPAYTGTAYSTTLAATGGSGGNAWSVPTNLAGLTALGVTLNASTGALSGTAVGLVAGSATFTVQVKDSNSDVATQQLTMNVYNPLSLPASGALPAATTNTLYHDSISAVGGSGAGYVFTVNGSALPTNGTSVLIADGISVSSTGNTLSINGTPTLTQTVTLTVSVKDSLLNSAGPDTYTIAVNPPASLALPAPGALPAATTNVAYNGGITATGGSGSGYVFTVNGTQIPTNGTAVLIADSLSVSSTGGVTLSITGTPTLTQEVSFTNVTVKDSANDTAGPDTYSIAVNPPAPLTLPASGALPSATTNVAYSNSINANGGSGSGYVFTVNGTQIPTDGTLVAISDGISVSSSGSNSLSISGTPTTVATVTLTNVTVKDSANDTAGPDTYTIAVNTPGNQVSGQIFLNNGCGNTPALPTFKVSINTNPVQNTTTDSNGNYSFASVPNGTYTITPSITGASSVFYPVTLAGVVVDNAPVGTENFFASVGYTVSGTVAYTGAATGPIYVELENQYCSGGTAANGTTLSAPGAFTIRGVAPGGYNLQTWRDNLGYGEPNASNATGSVSGLTVSNANVTGISASLADPGAVTLSTAPTLGSISGFADGAFINYQAITNNGLELPASYTLQWSTTNSFTSPAGSASFAATGGHNDNTWVLSAANVTGLTAGQTYYFRLQGVAGASTSNWSSTVGPVTLTAPSAANTITGHVTFTGTATGPLYAGFYDQNTNQIWATVVGSHAAPPTSPATFTVEVPSGTYQMFGIIDQNNNGLIDPGDITNVNGNNGPGAVTISGSGTENETLPSANSTVTVTTQYSQYFNGSTTTNNYNLDLDIREGIKLPIAVTLASGPNLINPVDMGGCGGNGCGSPQFQYDTNLETTVPKVGDTYTFNVTYSDGTTAVVTGAVSGVLGASALPTLISPTGTGISDTPNFDWTYPANPGNYLYQFYVCCNNNTIWSIPGNNSSANGFTNTQITPPLLWGVDPTDSTNLPSPSSLSPGTGYNWSIQAQDVNGNSAYASLNFETKTGPVSLPPANTNPLQSGVVNVGYSGSLTASGGPGGNNYYFTVNGTTIPTNNSFVSATNSDGLTFSNNGGNMLIVSGTPTSIESVTLTVEVFDTTNGSDTATVTYTVVINAEAPVSLPPASSNPLGSAIVALPFAGSINASGGSGGYSFSINGTSIPTTGVQTSIATGGDGLTAASSGGSTLSVAGTPASVETLSLEVTVTDTANSSDTATVTYSVPVTNGPSGVNNGNAKGTYVCKTNGYVDANGAAWATLSNVVLDGHGNITSGFFDSNGPDDTSPVTGTIKGTYSIGADNNGLTTVTSTYTSGQTGTSTQMWALALTNLGEPTSPAQEFRMVEVDDLGASPSGLNSTGNCYLATTADFVLSTISAQGFAFGFQGETSGGILKENIGRFTTSTGTVSGGTITTGYLDGMHLNGSGDNGGGFTGTYTAPNANGRLTFGILENGSSTTLNFAAYIIDANRMFLLETDAAAGLLSGEMRRQQQTSYSSANLNAAAVLYGQGLEYSSGNVSGYDSQIDRVSGNGAGTLTINQNYDDNDGTYSAGNENGATLAVTFDSANPGRATFPPGSDSAFFMFFDNNSAFYLDLNSGGSPNYLETGWLLPQTQTTFTNAALAGTYVLANLQLKPGDNSAGEIDLSSAGSIAANLSTGGQGSFSFDQPMNDLTYSWLTQTYGAFSILESGQSGGETCVVITPSSAVCMDGSGGSAKMSILQQ